MKNLRNKKFSYHHKKLKGLKMNVHSVLELAGQVFDYAHRLVLAEGFCQDLLETLFGKQCSSGASKDNLSLYKLVHDNTMRNQKVFKPKQQAM